MELREVKSLTALHELGSIREVAKMCNVSPAAVHKHLKTLESELGVRLYEKHDGRLRLTEAGRVMLPFAQEMLTHHDGAFTAVEAWKGHGRGVVRVGAGPSFSSNLLPPLIKRFRRRFPRVDVYVETGDSAHLIAALRSGTLDLIFDMAASGANELDFEQVARWEAQTGFISARSEVRPPSRLRALEKLPFILFRKGTVMDTAMAYYFDALNFRPRVVMRSDSSEAIKAMIRAGLGMSLLFLWNIEADPRVSAFTVIRTDAPPLSLHMALLRVRSSYMPAPVHEFIELARRMNWKNLHPVERDR